MYPKKPKLERKAERAKLRNLQHQPVSYEEADALYEAFMASHPIVTAILGQCMVEYQLEELLRFAMKKVDDKNWRRLTDRGGPLGSFSHKISMARALGLVSETTHSKLEKIGIIRNGFAHAKSLIAFNHPLVVAELQLAKFTQREPGAKALALALKEPTEENYHNAYRKLCEDAAVAILRRHNRGLSVGTSNIERKVKRLEARANPFNALAPRQDVLLGLLGKFPGLRSGDPTFQPPQGGMFGLAGELLPKSKN